MSYISNVYNVMIASPSDLKEERRLAREVIWDWNHLHSRSRNIVLLPIDWQFNATPTMGNRPQEIINSSVLKNADLLVGIFWTRVGTSTGKYMSGTVEEIELHVESNKPTMLYFSDKPASLSDVDSEQYRAVQELKKKYQLEGLTWGFETELQFKELFSRQLTLKLNDSFFVGYPSNSLVEKNGNQQKHVISDKAKELLIEATKDINGQIMRLSTMGGFYISANGRDFVEKGNPRSKAAWEEALAELEESRLIKALNYKREIFEVTDSGWGYQLD